MGGTEATGSGLRGEGSRGFNSGFDSILYDFSSTTDSADCDDLQGGLDGRDRLAYSGEIVSEFLVSDPDDERQNNARLVGACEWKDLRTAPLSKLPRPASKLFNVWQLDRSTDRPLYVDSRFCGVSYLTEAGTAVLTNSIPGTLMLLKPIIDLFCGPAAPPPACPTATVISGSGKIWSNYLPSRRAARANALSLAGPYAGVLAGLEFNDFICPNPACVNKTLGPVTAAATDIVTTIFSIGSLIYLETRYIKYVEFTWSATVTCV